MQAPIEKAGEVHPVPAPAPAGPSPSPQAKPQFLPETIDGVIRRLDDLIAREIADRSRIGYFAALYRSVTLAIKDEIGRGGFRHPDLVERLDVTFASRFFTALGQFRDGGSPSLCWAYAFEESRRWPPTVFQQLLFSSNAHINLDLGAAVSEAIPADRLDAFRADFDVVNSILAGQVVGLGKRLSILWPLLAVVPSWLSRVGDQVFDDQLVLARNRAWDLARELSRDTPGEWSRRVAEQDRDVARKSHLIADPGIFASAVFFLIRLGELGSVRWKIKNLATDEPSTETTPPGRRSALYRLLRRPRPVARRVPV